MAERQSFLREIAGARTRARRIILVGFLLFVIGFIGQLAVMYEYSVDFERAWRDFPQDPGAGEPDMPDLALGLAVVCAAAIWLGVIVTFVGLVLHIVATARRRRVEEDAPSMGWAGHPPAPHARPVPQEVTMVFNIGNQNAGVVNNVAGDQFVNGDQHGSLAMDPEAGRSLLTQLRLELRAAGLPAETTTVVQRELDACDRELRRPGPEPQAVGDRLAKVAQILVSAGTVVSAGTGLGAALTAFAGWLGRLGDPIRQALSGR